MAPNSSNNLAVYLGTSNVFQWRRVQWCYWEKKKFTTDEGRIWYTAIQHLSIFVSFCFFGQQICQSFSFFLHNLQINPMSTTNCLAHWHTTGDQNEWFKQTLKWKFNRPKEKLWSHKAHFSIFTSDIKLHVSKIGFYVPTAFFFFQSCIPIATVCLKRES